MAGGYVFRPVKRIKLATGTRDILIFTHNARKNGRHRASVQKGDAKSPVPLSTAEGSFSPQPIDSPYPSRSFGSSAVPTAFYILLPATHKFPTTPPTFSSSPPPLPSLPSILHHCPLHSELSRQPQSTRLPSRPSVPRASLQTGPVPGAPSSHASSQRRPGSPPPRLLGPHSSAPERRSTAARERLPGKDEADPSAPHPRPITGPAAAASPVTVSAAPATYSARVQGGETTACRLPGPSRGSRGCRVCGPAGRRRGAGGSALRLPGQQSSEPSRLRLTIGSGCSALPLIGAGA